MFCVSTLKMAMQYKKLSSLIFFFSDYSLNHKLKFDTKESKVLDANIYDAERYDIVDPRNPMNKRRREESKQATKNKKVKAEEFQQGAQVQNSVVQQIQCLGLDRQKKPYRTGYFYEKIEPNRSEGQNMKQNEDKGEVGHQKRKYEFKED